MHLPSFTIFLSKNSCLVRQICNGVFKRQIHRTAPCFKSALCDTDCDGGEKKILMDPTCKVALVASGNEGIGFSMATRLLKAGARNVVITGIDSCKGREAVHKLNSTFGKNKAMFVGANVTCMVQFEEAFKTTKETFKNIDIVVNCAGIIDGKNWEKEIVTNLVGTIRGTLLAYRYVGKEGSGKGGVVVNLAGLCGIQPLPPAPTFAATQFAIVGLTRSFGSPLHEQTSGIRVVQLLTGYTQTDFIKNIERKGMTPRLGNELNQIIGKAKKQHPEACAQALVHLIQCGTNGSLWAIEGSRLFELKVPHWESYKTLTAQYI